MPSERDSEERVKVSEHIVTETGRTDSVEGFLLSET